MKLYNKLPPLIVYVFFLWFILTSININKAFHIDDTFHLEAAEWIRNNPLKPMSGLINWGDQKEAIYEFNQPPLFFYFVSLSLTIFGDSEIFLHLFFSIFTFIALLFFSKLSNFLKVRSPFLLLTIFAFCPAFIVNQNLMTDVPILAISLVVMYCLLKGQNRDSFKYYLLSSIILSIGLLIKYTLLPLLLVILITILATGKFKKSVVVVVPLVVLLIWSIWNLFEFNFIHLFFRTTSISGLNQNNILAFMATLGAVTIITVVYIYNLIPSKITSLLIISSSAFFLLLIPLVYFDIIKEARFNSLLNYIFIINGTLLTLLICYQVIHSLISQRENFLRSPFFSLALYIIGVSAFIVLFAPFNATRHVLLLIPFILLFGHTFLERTPTIINTIMVITTIIVGLLLGISDWLYADFYRKNSQNLSFKNQKVWSIGHWGWQWYSKKTGMIIYSEEEEFNIREGEIIIIPKDVSSQKLSKDIQLDTIQFITETPTFFTFFSGKNFASMYNSFRDKPSWSLSKMPIDTIFICQVTKELEIEDIVNRIKSDDKRLFEMKNKALNKGISFDSLLMMEATRALDKKRNSK
ncbi:ArnT family glycosyltransferase [Flammeovirga pacifica]|uniref:Glycosyltransferase RgtA/B/C/D-like domain-containing protein n=1 Tax=Flammeovirga pacifica TaxID=915059 RepID=A0A1S1YTV6_FLAPC|nr:glycosyltransferase family 39 protein [Flammeovirga pacifica]OHX64446.1 hypothetical protein NH26_22945 [Flammeovirga pacifica]